jgi:hypothetical protein
MFHLAGMAALAALVLSAGAASADPRFRIEGDVLVYDSANPVDATLITDGTDPADTAGEIAYEDVGALRSLLERNADRIRTLRLTSDGGFIEAAYEMAHVIMDYGLDTEVQGECASACAVLFMAGDGRTLLRGGRIGLHPSNWGVDSLRAFYQDLRSDYGWEDEFAFAEWVYREGQRDANKMLDFMVDRGVSAGFAADIVDRGIGTMWYPSRAEMEAAGVLRPPADTAQDG